jgi:hypothetical protein
MAFRDYSGRAALKGWLNSDWFVGGNNTWVPTFSQWPLIMSEKLFGTYLGGLVLAICVAVTTANILLTINKLINNDSNRSTITTTFTIVISLLSPYWLGELGTSYENSMTVPIVLFGAVNLIKFKRDLSVKRFAWATGFLFTVATTLKMTNISFLIAYLVIMAILMACSPQSLKIKIKILGVTLTGVVSGLILIIPWWIYVYTKMQNPIFPFFNAFFKSPFYPEENWRDARWMMHSISDLSSLISGWQIGPAMSELPVADLRYPILFGILAIVMIRKFDVSGIKFVRLNSWNDANFLQLWILISIIVWARMFFYARYIQPVELLLGILVMYYVFLLIKSKEIINGIAFIILIVTVFSIQLPNWGSNSEGSLTGGQQQRWVSPLTAEVSKLKGVLLTTGATGFLRQTSPGISNMINLDSYLLPQKYISLVQTKLSNGDTVHFVSQGAANDPLILKTRIYELFGNQTLVEVNCEDSTGPIYGPFVVCTIRGV